MRNAGYLEGRGEFYNLTGKRLTTAHVVVLALKSCASVCVIVKVVKDPIYSPRPSPVPVDIES